ncbi:molybdopterin synthase sulfur carrier subunit [Vibrio spartinae]|uniref:Molybdopterin synthase sulfur carrier subunit n=1 Tax=Vibrio spartinae TaxID=1918945 RepID=A0A1N6M980_9VIBR|nr:molybdopterin synthase sulfur carrier subunit [Vibrio spartinae]QMV13803.1 Sulfur carrier protein MoaD [Vibrio spartinae]SIO96001.1 Molybdopterin synthase sulfur carrier subunit [Vibrio spartinae]
MIKVLFFAQTRELVGQAELELPCTFATLDALRCDLAKRSEKWALAMNADRLLAAINQTIVSLDTAIDDGDEIAFFPPVTGG